MKTMGKFIHFEEIGVVTYRTQLWYKFGKKANAKGRSDIHKKIKKKGKRK